MINQKEHLLNLKTINLRRLRVLELQTAQFGISVPPHIVLEIEDIKEENSKIDSQLKTLSAKSDSQTNSERTGANQININENVSGSTIILGNENIINNLHKKEE